MGMASKLVELRTQKTSDGQLTNKQTSQHVNNTTTPRYQRRTYYLRPDQIDNIESTAFHNKLDISEIVRRAVDAYLTSNINK